MYVKSPPALNKEFSNKDLLNYLKSLRFEGGFVDRLKVYYRPLVCPFVELINLVNPGDRIGDIGCGSGQFCLLLAEFAKPAFIYGIEINDKLVNNAKGLFKQHASVDYEFEKFDGEHFSNKINQLDIIFLNDVLHHVPKLFQKKFIKNLTAQMKSGAKLVIKDIDGSSFFVYCNKMHDLIFAKEIGNELSFNTTRLWVEEYGMEIIKTTKRQMYVYPHYTIVAQKK